MKDAVLRAGYPDNALNCEKMNRILRHRLRNLCAGLKMAVDSISEQVEETHPHLVEHCSLMTGELDDLLVFTERMDLLFSPLPALSPLSLEEILKSVHEYFTETFPFCEFEMEGEETEMVVQAGNWYKIVLLELLTNAGEAAGREGAVKMVWSPEPVLELAIVNTGGEWSEQIPVEPPAPFHTTRSRHDGIGLAIAQRTCHAMDVKLEIMSESSDATILKLSGNAEVKE